MTDILLLIAFGIGVAFLIKFTGKGEGPVRNAAGIIVGGVMAVLAAFRDALGGLF